MAKFFGSLGTASAALEAVNDVWRTRPFAGGFVTHHPTVDIYEDAGYLCIARGEPRFGDPVHAELARTTGSAAAWLAAFRDMGVAAPAKVSGRFSAVIVEPRSSEAVLITDRFATWPICYAVLGKTLAFAERADAVPGSSRRIAPQAIFDYLYFHVIPAPATIFEDVRRMPAGQVLHWRGGEAKLDPYWRPTFSEKRVPNLEEAKHEFRSLVRQAVQREATSAQVGAFLSGGTDSSTVSGMLCEVLGQPAKTYSIGFDAEGYDEMEYARIAAKRFGTDHHEHYVTPDDLVTGMPAVATHYEQPFGNSSALPAWICARVARSNGIDKMLAGDGGDELFGGNTRYAKQRVFGWYDAVPRSLRGAGLESAILALRRVPVLKKAASYVSQARVPMPDRLQTYNLLTRIGIGTVLEPAFAAAVDTSEPVRLQRDVWNDIDSRSLINRMLAFDWKYTLSDNDLPKVIGTADLAGLGVGFPLLDDDLLEFSLGIPPKWKVKGLTLRWFFKEALRGYLPQEIIEKKKHGFGLPYGTWMSRHEGLQALTRDALASLGRRGIVQASFLDRLVSEHLPAHPGYYGELVWILTVLELWLRAHAPDWRA